MYKYGNEEHTIVNDITGNKYGIHPQSREWSEVESHIANGGIIEPFLSLDEKQSIMKDAIKGKEETKNNRKIEHPQITGAFFKPSTKIDKIIARSDGLSNTDPLPTNNGCFDDIDEIPVPMTVGQLKKLRNAIIDREEVNHLARKNHIQAMKNLPDPLTYDYNGGWA